MSSIKIDIEECYIVNLKGKGNKSGDAFYYCVDLTNANKDLFARILEYLKRLANLH